MIKKVVLLQFILCTLLPFFGFAQQNRQIIDSVLLVLKSAKTDGDRIRLLQEISEAYSSFSKDSAIIYAEKAYTSSLKMDNDEQKFQSSKLLSKRYREKGIMYKALEYALLTLKFAETSGSKKNIIEANVLIADLYTNSLKSLPKALEYGNRALSIAKETGDLQHIISNLESVSITYFNFNKFDEALNYSREAYKFALLASDTAAMVRTLSGIGDGYRAKRNFAEALSYYNRAINISKPLSNNLHLVFIYNNIGVIYADSGDYKTAIKYFLSSVKIAKTLDNKSLLAFHYYNISDAYLKTKDYQNALKYNLLSIQSQEASGTVSNLNILYLSNAAINDSLGNYKAALDAMNKYVAMNSDSLLNETRNRISEMEVALESEKKQKQIDLISKDKERQKIIRNAFIAGSLLLFLLALALISRNKLKRSIEMERMRSRLSRDLHDDIGSTLSSINILSRTAQLNLEKTSDEKTKTALQKINERSQRLLNSMSDIIWNISPGNDTVEEVMSRMREYATTMLEAKSIDYTFNFPKQKMDCRLSMEVKNNLYLIFKEAVNNLSKYSGCTHATLALIFDEKNIHLTIEDNGSGFDEQEIKHRGGLVNMQQRAAEIKGSISIHTGIGMGTTIELTIPGYC